MRDGVASNVIVGGCAAISPMIVQLCTEFSGPMKERSKFIVTAAVLAHDLNKVLPSCCTTCSTPGSNADSVDLLTLSPRPPRLAKTADGGVAVGGRELKSYSPQPVPERQ